MDHPHPSLPRLGALALAFGAITLPVARGSVDAWAVALGLTLAVGALVAVSWNDSSFPRGALALVGVLLVAALQLVPVPAPLHGLSPGAARVFETSLAPLGLYPSARPLSLDPAASARELAKSVACTAAFAAAWRYASSRRRRRVLVASLALSSAAVATVVLTAALTGVGALLQPRFPFVNPNHLAGFLNLTGFIALGLAFRAHGEARALWALAFISAGSVVFLSLSRGGIATFFVGAAVFFALQVVARRSREESPLSTRHWLTMGTVAAALGIASFLALDPLVNRLRTLSTASDDVKIRLLSPALQVLRDFPVLGIGPGAFPTVFTSYQSESSSVTFTHLENHWLQPLIDLGGPAGLLLVGFFAWVWLAAVRHRDLGDADMGLLAGTAAVASHNLFDFSLGILGVAFPFAIAMGILARHRPALRLRPWVLRASILVAFLVAAGALGVSIRHDLERDRDCVERERDPGASAEAAKTAVGWHPADWVSPTIAGVRLAQGRSCREALPWLLRAMTLNPTAPRPHLTTAQCLAGTNDAAAKREFRLALMFGAPSLGDAARLYPRLSDLLDITPGTPEGLLALGQYLASANRTEEAAVVYQRLREEFSDDRALLPLAEAKALQREDADALDLARLHTRAHPSDASGWILSARALVALGRDDEAGEEIERGLAGLPGSPVLLGFLAERAMLVKRWSEARRLADQIAARSPVDISNKHLLIARALEGQGRVGEALERAKSAAAAYPTGQGPWVVSAGYAEQLGRYDEAISALQRAAELPGAPPDRFARRIARIKQEDAEAHRRALEGRAYRAHPGDEGQ